MLRHEDRAAILIGQDGGLEGADPLGPLNDLLLVKADERPEHGHVHGVVCDGQTLDGLAGHLPDGLPGDESQTPAGPGGALGDLHHETPHEHGGLGGGTLIVDGGLDLGEWDQIQIEGSGILGDDLSQLHHLVPGSLAGVRVAVKVDGGEGHAPLGDHVPGHGAVDAAGDQEHGLSVGAHGHAAGAGDLPGIEKGLVLADLHGQRDLGMVHVHLQVGIGLEQLPAQLPTDHLRGHGKPLVRPAGEDFKGFGLVPIGGHEPNAQGADLFPGLFPAGGDGYGVDAKDFLKPPSVFLQMLLRQIVDEDAPLLPHHMGPDVRQGFLDFLHQLALEEGAVEPLQVYLRVFDDQCAVVHAYLLLYFLKNLTCSDTI